MRRSPFALVALLVLSAALAACGDSGGGLKPRSGPTFTATVRTGERPTATAPGAAPPPTDVPAETVPPTSTTGAVPGPASSAPRIPAVYAIGRRALRPPVIGVTSRVPILLTLISEDGRAHSATLAVRPAVRLRVPAHGRASVLVPAPPRGSYRLSVDSGRLRGSLVVGERAPGP